MKSAILISLCLFASWAMAQTQAPAPAPALKGEWRLVGMIHNGEKIPLPNPDLYLSWTFFSNGTERLYWDRGTPEFCERFAEFSMTGGLIREKTFALNPKNAMDCAKDPDMQLDKETESKVEISEHEIRFHFQLGDDELIYLLGLVPGPVSGFVAARVGSTRFHFR